MSDKTTKAPVDAVVHTPGPWFPLLRHDGVPFGIASKAAMRDDSDSVCLMPGGARWPREQIEANARLIAAAPKLLESLKRVVALSDRTHDAWDEAKAAIAEAIGVVE